MSLPRKRHLAGGYSGGDSISRLYANIDESRNPLPRAWCPDAKCDHLGLAHDNMRVVYKGSGSGKNHKDAGSVRTLNPIPSGVGVYYFEVRIVSKGRDGYMGVGLSLANVNLNRLPGWDKDSYGYHGDDGNSFCSSGSGQPYGPTFTTNDMVGCGVNFVERYVFFTKNGINLGVAFADLPIKDYYPTVGLQTPGEIIEANFGGKPFVYDMSDLRCEMKYKIHQNVFGGSLNYDNTHKLVSTYLIHHGHCQAAEAFAKQEMQSIRNRQAIQKLVLDGRISDAISATERLYPTLLSTNPKLLFQLKCRQFVEMIAGVDPAGKARSESPMETAADSITDTNSQTTATNPQNSHPNGNNTYSNGSYVATHITDEVCQTEAMEVDTLTTDVDPKSGCHIETIIKFGRQLRHIADSLDDATCEKRLVEIYGLFAYENPAESPLSYLLSPLEREAVCSSLNSAVLESHMLSKEPPLQVLLSQTATCLSEMSARGIAQAAFVDLKSVIQ